MDSSACMVMLSLYSATRGCSKWLFNLLTQKICVYWPLMADSTRSNSRNIRTASSSGTSAIWKHYGSLWVACFMDAFFPHQFLFCSHLKDDTFNNFAIFLTLFFCLFFEVLIHLSSAHHILQKKNILGPPSWKETIKFDKCITLLIYVNNIW